MRNDIAIRYIEQMECLIRNFKKELNKPDCCRITVLNRDGYCHVGIWDAIQPQELILMQYKGTDVEEETVLNLFVQALDGIRQTMFGQTIDIETDIPWEELPENYEKLNKVFEMNITKPSQETVKRLKEEIDASYSMSDESAIQT